MTYVIITLIVLLLGTGVAAVLYVKKTAGKDVEIVQKDVQLESARAHNEAEKRAAAEEASIRKKEFEDAKAAVRTADDARRLLEAAAAGQRPD